MASSILLEALLEPFLLFARIDLTSETDCAGELSIQHLIYTELVAQFLCSGLRLFTKVQ
jgi:hypothetical protein